MNWRSPAAIITAAVILLIAAAFFYTHPFVFKPTTQTVQKTQETHTVVTQPNVTTVEYANPNSETSRQVFGQLEHDLAKGKLRSMRVDRNDRLTTMVIQVEEDRSWIDRLIGRK